MGVDVSAYIEKKNKETGKWELVTKDAVSARLKYILEDWEEMPKIAWDDLSEEMKEKFKKDENGQVYASFYVTTLNALEMAVTKQTSEVYTRLNTIIKALGAPRIYRDDGEECWSGDDEKKEKLTIPVNMWLMDDLQYAFQDLRKIGQRETLDLILSENIGWDGDYRIILTVC